MFLKRDQAMATVYAFGPFRLDEEAEILFRGREPTAVGQRAVALLRALVERPGAPVSKDVLIEAAWPGLVVEESNLPVQIAALRKVLGQEPGGEDWIETLPRRGYRFIGPMPTNFEKNGSIAQLPRAFVGVDTAPMHIAAAMGTPTLALFGPSGENEWGPWGVPQRVVVSRAHPCRPCGLDGCGGGKVSECLTTLGVDDVHAQFEALLSETGAAAPRPLLR